MQRCFRLLLVLLITGAVPAYALPAPMSEQDLMENSALVARVRVLSVTCTSVIKDEQTGEDLPGYLARLQVLATKEGTAKKGDEVLVTWRAMPTGIMGPWAVYYYPGEEMWTHPHAAERRGELCHYATTWWNAKGDDLKNPDARSTDDTRRDRGGDAGRAEAHAALIRGARRASR
jgi:hypothetical protein